MKLFIKKILFFFLLLLLTTALLQLFVTLRINGISGQKKGILELSANVNADLVLLGSSRSWTQLNADFFDTAFHTRCINMGVNGHSEITMATVRLKQYLLTNRVPKFAMLAFDPMSVGGNETNNENFFNKNEFAEYAFWPKKEHLLVVDYLKFNAFEKYLPLYAAFKYRLFNKCFSLAPNIKSHMATGPEMYKEKWDSIASPPDWTIAAGKGPDAKQTDSIIQSLKALKSVCTNNNIRLICIQTPVFKSSYNPVTFANTSRICSQLQIPLIDVNNQQIRNDLDNFHNALHLNTKGMGAMNWLLKNDSTLHSLLK
jgi:hypothetical protein